MIDFLAKFPSTNALCVSGIALAWTTFIASLLGWTIPDGWLLFVLGVATASVGQFTAKRVTQREVDR